MWARFSLFVLAVAFGPDAAATVHGAGASLQTFEEDQRSADATIFVQLPFQGVQSNKSRVDELHNLVLDEPQNSDARFRLGDARTRPRSPSALAASDSLCVEGRLVPQIWVLGAPKCGTTSLAHDLRAAGVPSNGEPRKEMRFFEEWARGHASLCNDADYPLMRRSWLKAHPECPTGGFRIIGDYTVDHMWLSPAPPGWTISATDAIDPGRGLYEACVPSILHSQMYEGLASRLTFAIMVRQPLSRVLSAYYYRREFQFHETVLPGDFQRDMQLKLKAMKSNIYDTYIWPTMYARHIENYLGHFDASQFIVAPMKNYFRYRCSMFHELSVRTGVQLACTVGEPTTHYNSNSHPALREALDNSVRDDFELAEVERLRALLAHVLDNSTRDDFESAMRPEVERLVVLLAHNSLNGMTLLAYNGTLGRDDEVSDWLVDGW